MAESLITNSIDTTLPGDEQEIASVPRSGLARIAGLLIVWSLVPPVYAGHKFPDYPVRPAAEYANKVAETGLILAVEPVEDPGQQKTYFDIHLSSKGILPVFIVIQNASPTDAFLFDKSAVGLGEAVEVTGKSARKNASLRGSGGLIDLAQANGTTEVVENLKKKEIRSKTLSPGSSVSGFVFVPVPTDVPRGKIHLQVPLTNSQNGETQVVNLFF